MKSFSAFTLTVLLSICAFETAVMGQTQNSTEEGFAISPIPIIQAVTEEGAGLALEYRYHLSDQNKKTPSSSTAFGGFITGNRSWGVGVSQKLYFKDDQWRARMAGSYVDVRYNFYGIGTEAGDQNVSVLMHQKGFGALGELLYRVDGLWYAGAQYRFLQPKSSFRPNPEFDSSVINPQELDVRLSSLGPRVTRDSRSDVDYPRDGSLFDLRLGFFAEAIGAQLTYQTYDLSYSKYVSLGPRQVLAVRGAACFARGDVPFFAECLLSASENLRGYRASRYRDRTMLASQAEYRWEAWKRVGFVGFVGAGEIAPKLQDFNSNDVLPGGGVGVRYRITRESHVNLRFDYAWGKNSHEAYFFIGEAF